ncbi:MAG: GatB/YqeY domain-containing protein [Bacteroidota bacterium]
MTLNERVTEDMKSAMKTGEKLKLETLRTIRAHLIELTKRGEGKDITPEEELAVLMTAVKKRKEAIDLYRKGGREELARQEELELQIINSYLPQQVTNEEAEGIIRNIIGQLGAVTPRDFGKVMPLAMKELKGRIDGKTVQELVKAQLEG